MHCMPCIHWRYAPDLHAYVHFTFKSPSNECWRLTLNNLKYVYCYLKNESKTIKGAPNGRCNVQVLFFERAPTGISNVQIRKRFKPTAIPFKKIVGWNLFRKVLKIPYEVRVCTKCQFKQNDIFFHCQRMKLLIIYCGRLRRRAPVVLLVYVVHTGHGPQIFWTKVFVCFENRYPKQIAWFA